MTETLDDKEMLDERVRVDEWRRKRLGEMRDQRGAGFTIRQVGALAEGGCDLHEAAALLAAGCTIPTAFDILS